ncbi:four-helix bundle copper-binding protein [Pseudomonas aeruginosa]|nr:four-helix bundle copper-binding protein [Pseudomonas aeruginosa]
MDRQPCWTFSPPGRVWGRTSEDWHRGRGFKAIERRCRRRNRLNCRHRRPAQGTGPAWAQSPGGAAQTRAINDPGNEDPGSLLETDADALLGGAAAQALEERCRLAAQACIRACERYLALCIESSREQRQHAGDCADLCRLAALLLERRSPWAPAACELAARYALACAERCDGDEPLERECAGACRRFVEACRPLLPA